MLKAVKLASDAEAHVGAAWLGSSGRSRRSRSRSSRRCTARRSAAASRSRSPATPSSCSETRRRAWGCPRCSSVCCPRRNGMLRIVDRAGLQVALDLASRASAFAREGEEARARGRRVPCGRPPRRGCARALDLAQQWGAPARTSGRRRKGASSTTSARTTFAAAALEDNAIGRAILFKKAREETRKKTHGHYPATERILDVLERYGSGGEEALRVARLRSRRSAFGELVVSETAHRLIEIFFSTTALKKDTGVDDPTARPRERRARRDARRRPHGGRHRLRHDQCGHPGPPQGQGRRGRRARPRSTCAASSTSARRKKQLSREELDQKLRAPHRRRPTTPA